MYKTEPRPQSGCLLYNNTVVYEPQVGKEAFFTSSPGFYDTNFGLLYQTFFMTLVTALVYIKNEYLTHIKSDGCYLSQIKRNKPK